MSSDDGKVERYIKAMEAVKGGTSLRKAAKQYSLNNESLRRRILGINAVDAKKGPQKKYLTSGHEQGTNACYCLFCFLF